MFHNKSEVDKILGDLNVQLEAFNSGPIDIVVCGGTALNALGLISRTTKDVDVLALVHKKAPGQGVLDSANPLPSVLLQAAEKVGRAHRLPKGWLNPGPTSALKYGLPDGLLERAQKEVYGPFLTVRFLGRLDQIYFKLYAAADQGGKHYDDLKNLQPSGDELLSAAKWSMTHDVSECYKQELKKVIQNLGYSDAAQRI